MTPTTKVMTLRLPADQARDIEAVARADGQSLTEAVRAAIDTHIESRRKDAEFAERIRQMMREERETLERLAR